MIDALSYFSFAFALLSLYLEFQDGIFSHVHMIHVNKTEVFCQK